ncbi:MAG: hypothetical protein WCO48_02840, partial [Candidatus Taylorbacteria bacterium]
HTGTLTGSPEPTWVSGVGDAGVNRPRCSGYFGICFNDSDNKWAVGVDGPQDFDLYNSSSDILLTLSYSTRIHFQGQGLGSPTVSLLGQSQEAYREMLGDQRVVITGINDGDNSLIVILSSENDIDIQTIQDIVSNITTANL